MGQGRRGLATPSLGALPASPPSPLWPVLSVHGPPHLSVTDQAQTMVLTLCPSGPGGAVMGEGASGRGAGGASSCGASPWGCPFPHPCPWTPTTGSVLHPLCR